MEFQVRWENKYSSNTTQLHGNAHMTVGRDRKYKNTLQTEDLQSFRKKKWQIYSIARIS